MTQRGSPYNIDAAGESNAATLQEYAAKRICVNESNFAKEPGQRQILTGLMQLVPVSSSF